MIELQLLDGFEVRRDGAAVALPRSARRLVAFLALHERPLHRIYVAGSLWLESTDDHANASLRSTLWRLGRQERALIDADGNLVRLVPEVTVDLHTRCRNTREPFSATTGRPPRSCAGSASPASSCPAGTTTGW